MSTVLGDAALHLGALLRRRATWWAGGAWAVGGPLFGMVVLYLIVRAGGIPPEAAPAVLAGLLPAALPGTVTAGYIPYGGVYLLVLGAVLVGNEYRWGTGVTLLLRRAGRRGVVASQVLALCGVVGLAVLAEFAVCAVVAWTIAALSGSAMDGPSGAAVLAALAACWLVGSAFALVGAVLAHALRSPAGAVGVGLVWVLGAESAIRGLATVLPGLDWLPDALLGPSVGALAVALGAAPTGAGYGVGPGGSTVVAVVVLASWALVAAVGSVLLVDRRDVATRC